MQEKLKAELGSDGYARLQSGNLPRQTALWNDDRAALNKRFKRDSGRNMNDPDINPEKSSSHSLRHTSATAKPFVSHGDVYNSVMEAGGGNVETLEMLYRRYGKHSFRTTGKSLPKRWMIFLAAVWKGNKRRHWRYQRALTGRRRALTQALQTTSTDQSRF